MRLRPYQEDCIDSVMTYCKINSGKNPICVLPTGSGKSIIIAQLVEKILSLKPRLKILVLAHRKELIEQNASKISSEIDVGIYHAGIGIRDSNNSVVFAGIQSIAGNLDKFKNVGLIIVDEAHLIPFKNDSRYRKVLNYFDCRIIGFTATPYRLDGGLLHIGDDAVFDQIVYDVSIREMIDQGYLCKMVSKISNLQPDLSSVNIRMGEYVKEQIDELMMDAELVQASVESIIAYGATPKKWLVFACGIKHAEVLKELIPDSEVITGKTPKAERERILLNYKENRIKCLINVDVLTTGFDEPAIDMVVMLRPTKSTTLYVQMVGRGLRIAPNKTDCLILDYAGNIAEHGAIDKVKIHFDPTSKKAKAEKAEFKVCPVCESVNEIDNDECFECGYGLKVVRAINHEEEPADIDINSVYIEPEWVNVDSVYYTRHKGKKGKRDTLKVEYASLFSSYSEWLCVEHQGWVYQDTIRKLDGRWLGMKEPWALNDDTDDYYLCLVGNIIYGESLIDLITEHNAEIFKQVTKILVDTNGKYPEIKDYSFEGIRHTDSTSELDKQRESELELAFL